jgi:hypothetical protein
VLRFKTFFSFKSWYFTVDCTLPTFTVRPGNMIKEAGKILFISNPLTPPSLLGRKYDTGSEKDPVHLHSTLPTFTVRPGNMIQEAGKILFISHPPSPPSMLGPET